MKNILAELTCRKLCHENSVPSILTIGDARKSFEIMQYNYE